MNVTMLRSLLVISALAMASHAVAQEVDESALEALDKNSPVTAQPIREPVGAVELRAAMRRISYNSNDADALADAGNASLALGDANAALNFFTRANAVRPNNGRIISGLASATVRTENPFEALRLFDDAVRFGISERTIAADRALAFDLLGNFARAQQDYKLARTASTSDDLLIRQAISLSLAGQKADADAMLVPLLQKNSAAAWRARAFMLAARGDFRESTKVTQGFMDATSAQRMERYLRLMPELTGAQQAAAIHLGHFPASQYVGRDSEDVRRVASTIPPVTPGPGESRLIPTGTPLGQKSGKAEPAKTVTKRESKRERQAREKQELKVAVAAIPESAKLPKTDRSRLGTETARNKVDEAQAAKLSPVNMGRLPPPETARPLVTVASPLPPETVTQKAATLPLNTAPVSAPAPAAATVLAQQTPVPSSQSVSVPTVVASGSPTITAATIISPQGPTPNGTPIAPSSPSVLPAAADVAPAITPPVAKASTTPAFDLASIVSAIEIPESEQKPSAIPVDLKKIKAAAPKTAAIDANVKTAKLDPKAAIKAKAEAAQPARFWVQIATGDAGALGFDYRKWSKKSAELFKGQSGWTSAWGKTSRLLVGPFADLKTAKKWEADFKKSGGDGFMWKSENGVVVTALKSK
jgi:tetratricopeptide (TPR) repeat protein